MWLERKLNDSCSERGKQVFYEVYYDLNVHENNNQRMHGPTKSFLAITWHVQQQKTTITNKYPLSKKRKKRNEGVENTSPLKFLMFLGTGDDKEWSYLIFYHTGKKCTCISFLRMET